MRRSQIQRRIHRAKDTGDENFGADYQKSSAKALADTESGAEHQKVLNFQRRDIAVDY
jgi:hypothetical protein